MAELRLREKVLSLTRLMRSILLLALLAIVPVHRICLALDPRTHVNRFFHSLYPRHPPLLNLLRLTPPYFSPLTLWYSRHAPGKYYALLLSPEANIGL